MRLLFARSGIVTLVVLLLVTAFAGLAAAAPEGTLTWGLHVTLATRWLDPSDTEAFINPFMVLYAIHDALVKPMPAGDNTPSLAESWTVSKDGLTYEFVLRRESGRGRLQEAARRRRAVQVRELQSRHRAGDGGLRGLLAQGAQLRASR
jgi:ABC-type transport system substrate-binding protein